jgi:hypothetical protein
MSLEYIYNPDTFIKKVIDTRYIQIQDTYGNIRETIDYKEFVNAIIDGRFIEINLSSSDINLQFTSASKATTGLNELMTIIGELKTGTYTETIDNYSTETINYSDIYHSNSFIKGVIDSRYIQIQDRLGAEVKYTIDYLSVNTSFVTNRFLKIYTSLNTVNLQFITDEDANLAHTIFRQTVDDLKDGVYGEEEEVVLDVESMDPYLQYIYDPSNFIKEVIDNRYIQIRDNDNTPTVQETLDYTIFASAYTNGRILIVTKNDDTYFKLYFTTSSKASLALSKLMEIIEQLKRGTYNHNNITTYSIISDSSDYSVMYHSSNFIKGVSGKYIQIQDRMGENVKYSLDFNTVTSTITTNRFLFIYRSNLPKITLQFITSEDAQLAMTSLMTTVDQLRDNVYNYSNNEISGDIYNPDTFIVTITADDYSVQLITTKGLVTHSLVATQVTSIYSTENYVKVKNESSDQISTLTFETSEKAIEGAEKLRLAIKKILDRISTDPEEGETTIEIKSYSEIFENQDTWVLNPTTNFNISSCIVEYYEYICPDGTTSCLDSEKVKRSCEGLVEFTGDEESDVLDKVTIYFNKAISGRATMLSK